MLLDAAQRANELFHRPRLRVTWREYALGQVEYALGQVLTAPPAPGLVYAWSGEHIPEEGKMTPGRTRLMVVTAALTLLSLSAAPAQGAADHGGLPIRSVQPADGAGLAPPVIMVQLDTSSPDWKNDRTQFEQGH